MDKKEASLEKLTSYTNETVIRHFCFHEELSFKEGEELFKALLGWMWLANKRAQENKQSYLFGPLLKIDKLWHTFILHSQLYLPFCDEFFGSYFHHKVEPPGFEHHLSPEELNEYLSDCFENLGESWIRLFFADLIEE